MQSLAFLALALAAAPQEHAPANVVVPQARAVHVREEGERVVLASVRASVDVHGRVAVTTLDVGLRNPGERVGEAELWVPVPDGTVVRGFDFEGAATEPTARLLPADEARSRYNAIVHAARDPALLELAGARLVRSSVFPVPPKGVQTVRLVYENVLAADGARVDYVLPRSEAHVDDWIEWSVDVRIRGETPLSAVYSPTHEVQLERTSPSEVRVTLAGDAARQPGPFRLSYLGQGEGPSATLFACPDEGEDGWFLLLAGLPLEAPDEARAIRREVLLVLDTSGSMLGEKLEQARAAALGILAALEPGERFGVISYASDVRTLFPAPVEKTPATLAQARRHVERLAASGGTNLSGALAEALRQDHEEGFLPLVLLLTDGWPTVGVTDEAQIRLDVRRLDVHGRRLFTFGVGDDVNAPLLDHVAATSRARSTYVAPGDDVEIAVSEVYESLRGPVLSTPVLRAIDAAGGDARHRVGDLAPARIDDLYEGGELVVLGRYFGSEPLGFELSGDWFGTPRTFRFDFALDGASVENSFVPRLWASRRIGQLVEGVRRAGTEADGGGAFLRELSEEILALSVEHGVLCEYTAFLALEGTDFARRDETVATLAHNLVQSAQRVRSGRDAVERSRANAQLVARRTLARLDAAVGADARAALEGARVRQVADRTFFRRKGAWVDARLLARGVDVVADRIVRVGSREHHELAQRLVDERRGGILSLHGSLLLELDGEAVLVAKLVRKTVEAQ